MTRVSICSGAALAAMSGFESFEQRKVNWNQFADQIEDAGLPWLQDPENEYWTWSLVMNGDTEKAVDRYLEVDLTRPLTYNLLRHTKRLYAFFAPVYEDPRVQAKLAEQGRRYEQMRADVRENDGKTGMESIAGSARSNNNLTAKIKYGIA